MDDVNAGTFLRGLFSPGPDECVVLARRHGRGFPCAPATLALALSIGESPAEWYTCCSTVVFPAGGQPTRRRARDAVKAHVLMLDDIGTGDGSKCGVPPVEPTAVVETSEGNHQYIYRLRPTDDWPLYEALQESLAAAGRGDPGAGGRTRLIRVPGSLNTRRGGFVSRVVQWRPDAPPWTLKKLSKAFGATPSPRAAGEPPRGASPPPAGGDPLLGWLRGGEWLLGPPSGGFYPVMCPWAGGHGDPSRGEAHYSPLGESDVPSTRGFKCFHAHCAGKSVADFMDWALANGYPGDTGRHGDTGEAPAGVLAAARAGVPRLSRMDLPDAERSPSGRPLTAQPATYENMEWILRSSGLEPRYDIMGRGPRVRFADPAVDAALGPMAGHEAMACAVDACRRLGIQGHGDILEAVTHAAMRSPYHPFEDWILAAPWDGGDEFTKALATVDCAPGNGDAMALYLRRWLVQCVQAVRGWREPKQVASVLVLAGPQNCGKTTWLCSLAPDGFTLEGVLLHLSGARARDNIMEATAAPIVELGEIDSSFRKADTGALKAFLSRKRDAYRSPYARREVKHPRVTSFCGTVNDTQFLTDETGHRRYWPVAVRECDIYHSLDLARLWGQANAWWEAGESWTLDKGEEASRHERAEEDFRHAQPAEELAEQWLDDHAGKPPGPMNAVMFCREIGVELNNVNKRLARVVMTRRLGPMRHAVDGVRRAWAVPGAARSRPGLRVVG